MRIHHTDLFSSFRPLIAVSAGPCFRKLKAKTFFVILNWFWEEAIEI